MTAARVALALLALPAAWFSVLVFNVGAGAAVGLTAAYIVQVLR